MKLVTLIVDVVHNIMQNIDTPNNATAQLKYKLLYFYKPFFTFQTNLCSGSVVVHFYANDTKEKHLDNYELY